MSQALERAITIAGGLRPLAAKLGITFQAVQQWKVVPPLRVLAVEAATGVPKEELRPDIYHPKKARTQMTDLEVKRAGILLYPNGEQHLTFNITAKSVNGDIFLREWIDPEDLPTPSDAGNFVMIIEPDLQEALEKARQSGLRVVVNDAKSGA